ncbi:unnamed protein product [Linum tenue]|uniref:Cytochrome P450 n=1 Tax=Linum tenue TaxID=586396 RepID=A0AAV0QTH5_9ROSI|nr:unnamed protein product [Linum tenue]
MGFLAQHLHCSFLLLPAIFFCSAAYFLLNRYYSSTSSAPPKKHLPPSPPGLPVIGNLHQIGRHPHRTFAALARRYAAPVMLLRLGSRPALLVSTGAAARELFKNHDLLVSTRVRIKTIEKLFYDAKTVASAPPGDYWRHARATCVLHLLSNKRVQSFASVRAQETNLVVERLVAASRRGARVDLSDVATCLSNDVICRVAFGGKSTSSNRFKELLDELMSLLGGYFVGDFIPSLFWVNWVSGVNRRVDKTFKEFDDILESVLIEHEKNGGVKTSDMGEEEGKSFVDVLLEEQKDGKSGHFLGRDNIKALLLDMFVGGTDTTATLVEWVMAELLRHPDIMNKLQHEVRTVAKGNVNENDLDNMTYLKQVILETLRLHPPVPLLAPRELMEDCTIMGYNLAAGTFIFTNAWAIGRDPNRWADPDEFQPERFANRSLDDSVHAFDVVPFGAGRRGCAGRSFALATAELLIANLVGRFDWALPDGGKAEDLDMSECTLPTIHLRYPLLAMATPV